MVAALEGQVAVVTGGGSGIGRATVRALATAGARVAVLDQNGPSAQQVVDETGRAGGDAVAFVVDLADVSLIRSTVNSIVMQFGRIDILVNAAGVSGGLHSALDYSDQTYDLVMNVNLRAPFVLIRAVGAHMVERGGGGRIVNVSSSAAFRATTSPPVYAASKAGINALTRVAAGDLGPHGINVNAVAPGLTKTPMTAGIGDSEAYDRLVSSGPLENLLHRVSEAEDVANVILFLCLAESRQITGQVINTSAGAVV